MAGQPRDSPLFMILESKMGKVKYNCTNQPGCKISGCERVIKFFQ